MYQWGKFQGVEHVTLLPDGCGTFSRRMGMLVDKDNLGFGLRSWRYSMLVEDGEITKMFVEPGLCDNAPGDPFEVSDAETMLSLRGVSRSGQGCLNIRYLLRRRAAPGQGPLTCARVGRPVGGEKPGLVDLSVALRGREAGVAQELLDRAQVAAACEQMGGEAVAERVRGRRDRQAERAPQPRHGLLHEPGLKPLAAHAHEEGIARFEPVRAGGKVIGDRFGHDW